jgi:hypothetical protein
LGHGFPVAGHGWPAGGHGFPVAQGIPCIGAPPVAHGIGVRFSRTIIRSISEILLSISAAAFLFFEPSSPAISVCCIFITSTILSSVSVMVVQPAIIAPGAEPCGWLEASGGQFAHVISEIVGNVSPDDVAVTFFFAANTWELKTVRASSTINILFIQSPFSL